jgi:hypothetical protein
VIARALEEKRVLSSIKTKNLQNMPPQFFHDEKKIVSKV